MTFSFFLSIYSRCGAPASWAARHTTVCLDIFIILCTLKLPLTVCACFVDSFIEVLYLSDVTEGA